MKFTVEYDGPSRPILVSGDHPPRMFSVSEFINGRWQSFDGEVALLEGFARFMRRARLVMPELGKEKPGPKAGAGFAPAAARVGSKKPGTAGTQHIVSGGRVFLAFDFFT